MLNGVFRRTGRIGRSARCEQPAVASKEMFETQIGLKVSCGGGDSVIVIQAVAGQFERLRLLLPFQSVDVERPQVPRSADHVSSIGVEMLSGHGPHLGGTRLERTQI